MKIKTLVVLAPLTLGAVGVAYGETDNQDEAVDTLETIHVSDTPFSQQVGTQKLTEEQIKRRPTKDGNITELLRTNPNVQFSNTSDTSTSGGEIAPNEVSIHGASYYSNNYTIDGLSNNDNMNPSANNEVKNGNDVIGYSPADLPGGGTQSFWIDSSLIQSLEVFDSNISAKYGRFSGGVINAELKDPDLSGAKGKVYYRITRDDWASFKVENAEDFEKAESLGDQPQFTKQQYGIVLNQPISDKAGLLFQYNRTESKIPYHHSGLGLWENQRRTSESYLLRGIYLPDNGDIWRATVMYSPHFSRYYKNNIKNGKFTNTGGGVQVSLDWEKDLSWGKMKSIVAYKKAKNKSRHASNVYTYYANALDSDGNDVGWCSSYASSGKCTQASEGGYGKYSTEKDIWTFKQDYTMKPFDTAAIEHKINFGWEVELAQAKYKRDEDAYLYNYNKPKSSSTYTYLRTYTVYPALDVSVSDNNYAAYIEDSMTWKRLNATLGARLDHNQYIGRTNIAPRFSLSYDVFGDEKTRLFGGVNRYYDTSILSYKLRSKSSIRTVYSRSSETASFTAKETSSTSWDVSNLDTPYRDEYSLGIAQKMYDTLWTFKWVNSHTRNQYVRTTDKSSGTAVYMMTNKGRSKTNSFTLEVAPLSKWKWGEYAEFDWRFGAHISKTNKNYNAYDESAEDEGYEKMLLEGKLLDITNGLPATDYNNPWSAFLEWNTHIPKWRLDWSQRFSYSSGYRYYEESSGTCPTYSTACGDYSGKVKVYDVKKQGSYFNLDWRFAYKQPTYQDQFIEFTVDINNVLNRKILTSSSRTTNTYKMGRNFWFGVSYNW